MTEKWDKRFLALARHVSFWSKDPSTRVGAVIVDDKKRVVSLGYNGFPRGVADTTERYLDRETKYKFVCHAERNALDNAPHSVEGCTLYATLQPCADCAKSIIQHGIKRVVTKNVEWDRPDLNWDISLTMMAEAGVQIDYLEL